MLCGSSPSHHSSVWPGPSEGFQPQPTPHCSVLCFHRRHPVLRWMRVLYGRLRLSGHLRLYLSVGHSTHSGRLSHERCRKPSFLAPVRRLRHPRLICCRTYPVVRGHRHPSTPALQFWSRLLWTIIPSHCCNTSTGSARRFHRTLSWDRRTRRWNSQLLSSMNCWLWWVSWRN